jgi:hypothetical protein
MIGISGVTAAPSIKDAKKACIVSLVALVMLVIGLRVVLKAV